MPPEALALLNPELCLREADIFVLHQRTQCPLVSGWVWPVGTPAGDQKERDVVSWFIPCEVALGWLHSSPQVTGPLKAAANTTLLFLFWLSLSVPSFLQARDGDSSTVRPMFPQYHLWFPYALPKPL